MNTSLYDLLPLNATPLERDLSRSMSPIPRIEGKVPLIATQKRVDIPDSVVPWLIYEYGLGELLPYLSNPRVALTEGIQWQRIRGTPESLLIALGWVGINARIDEYNRGTERWAYYELDLGVGTLDPNQFRQVLGLAAISQPVRCRLDRIYGAFNQRRFILSSSLLSGGNLLSDDSGYTVDPDNPQQSFGNVISSHTISPAVIVGSAIASDIPALVRWNDGFILDLNLLSDYQYINSNYPIVLVSEGAILINTYRPGWGSDINWGQFKWDGEGLNMTVNSTLGAW